MVIIKVFNNNSVAVLSDDRQDVIVTGSGIGFRKKAGDRVDESKIERQYVFQDEHKKRLEQSLTSIPNVCFEITEWIVKKATQLKKISAVKSLLPSVIISRLRSNEKMRAFIFPISY